jgi:hypothetical protein
MASSCLYRFVFSCAALLPLSRTTAVSMPRNITAAARGQLQLKARIPSANADTTGSGISGSRSATPGTGHQSTPRQPVTTDVVRGRWSAVGTRPERWPAVGGGSGRWVATASSRTTVPLLQPGQRRTPTLLITPNWPSGSNCTQRAFLLFEVRGTTAMRAASPLLIYVRQLIRYPVWIGRHCPPQAPTARALLLTPATASLGYGRADMPCSSSTSTWSSSYRPQVWRPPTAWNPKQGSPRAR